MRVPCLPVRAPLSQHFLVKAHVQVPTPMYSAFCSSSLRARRATFNSRCMTAADRPPALMNVRLDNSRSWKRRDSSSLKKLRPSSPPTSGLHSTSYRPSYSHLHIVFISHDMIGRDLESYQTIRTKKSLSVPCTRDGLSCMPPEGTRKCTFDWLALLYAAPL